MSFKKKKKFEDTLVKNNNYAQKYIDTAILQLIYFVSKISKIFQLRLFSASPIFSEWGRGWVEIFDALVRQVPHFEKNRSAKPIRTALGMKPFFKSPPGWHHFWQRHCLSEHVNVATSATELNNQSG